MSQVSVRHPIANTLNYVGLIGSTNGLICISLDKSVCIYNPITRIYNMVYGGFSRLHPYHVAYGFGYDMDSDDYKIVAITNFDKRVKVYSLKTGLWEKKKIVYPAERTPSKGIFLNGYIHWMDPVQDDLNIVSFDVHMETFGQLATPAYNDGRKMLHLDILGERLSMLCNYTQNYVMDLWVMQVYGSSDSWTRLASIAYPENDGWMRFWKTLWTSDDGKILLCFGHSCYLYDCIHGSLTFVIDTGNSSKLSSFDESLVSPIGPGIRYRLRSSKAKSKIGETSSI
ncbi:F-box associated interaction domain-containing protein [Artemisia annua]|uniref:F-box associated interaction domain-containing protein n=1 Tax=Artemisia annua TaxID=35608 RepID=A0A2U1QBZ0_ARTAN|nr:F-box associated interaction domain-containing protein [Artemisia annua]